MWQLSLSFVTFEGEISLSKTLFIHPYLRGRQIEAIRGGGSAPVSQGTFQWTSAVKALAVFFVRNAAIRATGDPLAEGGEFAGGEGTLAASLDYAISKQPVWLSDMFGLDQQGQSLFRRLVRRMNPERKLPGPVVIALNPCDSCSISIELDGVSLDQPSELLRIANAIEQGLQADPKVNRVSRADDRRAAQISASHVLKEFG